MRVREKVKQMLSGAFREVFQDDTVQLVPIMNHQSVHVKLVEWDLLQAKLESVEVCPPARSASYTCSHCLLHLVRNRLLYASVCRLLQGHPAAFPCSCCVPQA